MRREQETQKQQEQYVCPRPYDHSWRHQYVIPLALTISSMLFGYGISEVTRQAPPPRVIYAGDNDPRIRDLEAQIAALNAERDSRATAENSGSGSGEGPGTSQLQNTGRVLADGFEPIFSEEKSRLEAVAAEANQRAANAEAALGGLQGELDGLRAANEELMSNPREVYNVPCPVCVLPNGNFNSDKCDLNTGMPKKP
jgi:hypothetical protein